MPVITALRWEDHKRKASLGCMTRPRSKQKQTTNKTRYTFTCPKCLLLHSHLRHEDKRNVWTILHFIKLLMFSVSKDRKVCSSLFPCLIIGHRSSFFLLENSSHSFYASASPYFSIRQKESFWPSFHKTLLMYSKALFVCP
jgi:hypothetical protein